MHDLPLSSEHIEMAKNGPFSPQELEVKETQRYLVILVHLLHLQKVVSHLLLCHIDQSEDVFDLFFDLFHYSQERLWASLALLGQWEDLAHE